MKHENKFKILNSLLHILKTNFNQILIYLLNLCEGRKKIALKPNGTSTIWAKERKNQKRIKLGHNMAKSEKKSYIYKFVCDDSENSEFQSTNSSSSLWIFVTARWVPVSWDYEEWQWLTHENGGSEALPHGREFVTMAEAFLWEIVKFQNWEYGNVERVKVKNWEWESENMGEWIKKSARIV
jgi:hypothetical protein